MEYSFLEVLHKHLICSPDCRAPGTFISGVNGMLGIAEDRSFSLVTVRLGTRA